jgi:uncharacterized protein (TIGR03083 family)
MDTWGRFDAEREALCNDLAGLEAGQWDTQSLCTEWKVRHVVAHLLTESDMKLGAALMGSLKNGMDPMRYIARMALAVGTASPESLLTRLRATVGTRKTPPFAKPSAMLVDTVCHSGDIRRPLGIKRTLPRDTVIEVAENMKNSNFPLGTKKRIAGLRLVATDVDWSTGNGPEVEGPAESLILVMAGRRAGLDDLTGEGVAVLSSRT